MRLNLESSVSLGSKKGMEHMRLFEIGNGQIEINQFSTIGVSDAGLMLISMVSVILMIVLFRLNYFLLGWVNEPKYLKSMVDILWYSAALFGATLAVAAYQVAIVQDLRDRNARVLEKILKTPEIHLFRAFSMAGEHCTQQPPLDHYCEYANRIGPLITEELKKQEVNLVNHTMMEPVGEDIILSEENEEAIRAMLEGVSKTLHKQLTSKEEFQRTFDYTHTKALEEMKAQGILIECIHPESLEKVTRETLLDPEFYIKHSFQPAINEASKILMTEAGERVGSIDTAVNYFNSSIHYENKNSLIMSLYNNRYWWMFFVLIVITVRISYSLAELVLERRKNRLREYTGFRLTQMELVEKINDRFIYVIGLIFATLYFFCATYYISVYDPLNNGSPYPHQNLYEASFQKTGKIFGFLGMVFFIASAAVAYVSRADLKSDLTKSDIKY